MIPTDFKDADWTDRLTRALAGLAEAQMPYRGELAEQRLRYAPAKREGLLSHCARHPSDNLISLYYNACQEGDCYDQRYRPLRSALDEMQSILGEHPVFASVLDPSDDRQEFWIQLPSRGGSTSLLKMVGGLMGRAMEVPEDGFRVASSELNALLNLSQEREAAPLPSGLDVGYNVVLFHGLRFNEKIEIEDEMTVVPFDQTGAFVDENVLQDSAPDLINYNSTKLVGAILKPFRWKPAVRSLGDEADLELDWAESFFDDTRAFVELLAISHGVPVVYLLQIPHCFDRSVSWLLGKSYYHSAISRPLPAYSIDSFAGFHDASMDALDEAKKAFRERNGTRYRRYAPVISRLAESLARSGRFGVEDKILDVAIALERMYKLGNEEITFKLKTRAACFLETDTESRMQVFKDVKEFYDARSAIVHNRTKKASNKKNIDAFGKGFELARRSLAKLLHDGPPPDWDELVIAGTEN